MLILSANKVLATLLIIFCAASNAFADIPSAKGENTISIGTGLPGILNGSIQVFHPIKNQYGIGFGVGGHILLMESDTHIYATLRFHHTTKLSICAFYEEGKIEQAKGLFDDAGYSIETTNTKALGIGVSKYIKNGTLNTALSFTNSPNHRFGIGTGIKVTKLSGFFYGASIVNGNSPAFFIGKTIKLHSLIPSIEKTKSGEIRD